MQAATRERKDVRNLADILQSGDLKSAQQAFTDLKDAISGATKTPLSGNTASGQDIKALGQDLSSGDLAAAQKDFAQFQTDIESVLSHGGGAVHHHGHHSHKAAPGSFRGHRSRRCELVDRNSFEYAVQLYRAVPARTGCSRRGYAIGLAFRDGLRPRAGLRRCLTGRVQHRGRSACVRMELRNTRVRLPSCAPGIQPNPWRAARRWKTVKSLDRGHAAPTRPHAGGGTTACPITRAGTRSFRPGSGKTAAPRSSKGSRHSSIAQSPSSNRFSTRQTIFAAANSRSNTEWMAASAFDRAHSQPDGLQHLRCRKPRFHPHCLY